MKARDKNKVSATFHHAGLVVPYNKKTEVGYREIPETTQSLKKIFNNILETHKNDDQKAKDLAFDKLTALSETPGFGNTLLSLNFPKIIELFSSGFFSL